MMLSIAILITVVQRAAADSCTECLENCGKTGYGEGACQNICTKNQIKCPNPIYMDLCTKANDSVCQAGQRSGCGDFTDCTDCGNCPKGTTPTIPTTTITTTTTTDCNTVSPDPTVWSITPAPAVVQGPGCTKHGENCVSSRNYPETYATTTRDYCTIKVPAGSTLSVETFDTEPHYTNQVRVIDDALPPVIHAAGKYYRGDFLTVDGQKKSGHAKCALDGMVTESEAPIIWKSDGLLWNNRDDWNTLKLDHKETSVKEYAGWKICFTKKVPKSKSSAELAQNQLTNLEPLHCSRKLAYQNACEPNPDDPVCKKIFDSPASKRDELCFQATNAFEEASLTRAQLRDQQKCKFECGLCNGFYKTTRPVVDFGEMEERPCQKDADCESNVCEMKSSFVGKCKIEAANNNGTQPTTSTTTTSSPSSPSSASTTAAAAAAAAANLDDCPILYGYEGCESGVPGEVDSLGNSKCIVGGKEARRAKKVGEWHCRDDSQCINWGWRCDGGPDYVGSRNDCADDSDESWGCPGDIDGNTGLAKMKVQDTDFNDILGFNGGGGALAAPLVQYHGFEYTKASRAFFTAATGGAKVDCRANAFPGFKNVTETAAVAVDKQPVPADTLNFQQRQSSDCADPSSASYGKGGHINFGSRKACNAVVGPLTFLLRSAESYVSGTKAAWGLPGYGAGDPASPAYKGDAYSTQVRPAITENVVLVCSNEGSLFVGRPTQNGYNPSDRDETKDPLIAFMDSTASCNYIASLFNLAVSEAPMELNIHARQALEEKKVIFDNSANDNSTNDKDSWTAGSSSTDDDGVSDDLADRDDDFWEAKQLESYVPDGDFRSVDLWKGRTVEDWPDRFIADFFSDGFAPTSIWGASMKGNYRYENITRSITGQGWVSPAANVTLLTPLDKLELRMRWEIVSFLTEYDAGRDAFGEDKYGQHSGFRHYAKQMFKDLIRGFTVADRFSSSSSNNSRMTFGFRDIGMHPVAAAIAAARAGMISKIRGNDHDGRTFEMFSTGELMAWGDPNGPSGSGANVDPGATRLSLDEMRFLDLDARFSATADDLDARLFVVEGKVQQKDDNTEAVQTLLRFDSTRNAAIQTLEDGASERDSTMTALANENSVLQEQVVRLQSQMIIVMDALEDRRARAVAQDEDTADGKALPIAAIVIVTALAVVLLVAGAVFAAKARQKRSGTRLSEGSFINNLESGGILRFGTEDEGVNASKTSIPRGKSPRKSNVSYDSAMSDREVFSTKYVQDTGTLDVSGSTLFSFESMGSVLSDPELENLKGGSIAGRFANSVPYALSDTETDVDGDGVGGSDLEGSQTSDRSSMSSSHCFDDSFAISTSDPSQRVSYISEPLTPVRSFGPIDQSIPQELPLSISSSSTSYLSQIVRVRSFGSIDQSIPQELPLSRSSSTLPTPHESGEMAEDPDATIVRRRKSSTILTTNDMSSTNPRLSPAVEEEEDESDDEDEDEVGENEGRAADRIFVVSDLSPPNRSQETTV